MARHKIKTRSLRSSAPIAAAVLCSFSAVAQPCHNATFTRVGPNDGTTLWPRGLAAPSAVYDAARSVTVVIGTSSSGGHTEVWEWDGFAWSGPLGQAGNSPPPLFEPAVGYHEESGRVVLFGGSDGGGAEQDKTYLWDGHTWEQPSTLATRPAACHGAGMAYSDFDHALILVGGVIGEGAPSPLQQTVLWNGTEWTIPPISAAQQPFGGRARNNMATDVAHSRIVFCDPREYPPGGDQWIGVWERSQGAWARTSEQPVTGTSIGFDVVTAYETSLGYVVRMLSDGASSYTQLWMWDGDLWPFIQYINPPLTRHLWDLTTTTDVRRGRIVILGRPAPAGELELWEFTFAPGGVNASPATITYDRSSSASIMATGAPPISYHWRSNGVGLEDNDKYEGTHTRAVAIDTRLARCERGRLDCIVTNPCGQIITTSVDLAIPFVADFNIDGGVDGRDVEAFFTAWENSDPFADADCNGGIDGGDVEAFFRCFVDSCDL